MKRLIAFLIFAVAAYLFYQAGFGAGNEWDKPMAEVNVYRAALQAVWWLPVGLCGFIAAMIGITSIK